MNSSESVYKAMMILDCSSFLDVVLRLTQTDVVNKSNIGGRYS